MLSHHLTMPREGHLEQAFRIFAYLKAHDRSTLVFDDTYPDYTGSNFPVCDWSEFYPDSQEAIPPNASEPRGKAVITSYFVDASHGSCMKMRRSQTGVLLYVNRAPMMWCSKRQSSTFGSEFVAINLL
jgi:hypothetical protein